MAVSLDQVKELLGCGLSNEVVASAVGCDPSYISQLLSDENFAAEISALRVTALAANNQRDKSINSIEDALLVKLHELVEGNMIYKPDQVLRAFHVVNNAKRRGVAAHEGQVVNNTVVNLQIPRSVVNNFVVDARGTVVEVEGQTMVTMPAHQLLRTLAQEKVDERGKYQKVAAYLPGSAIEHGSGS